MSSASTQRAVVVTYPGTAASAPTKAEVLSETEVAATSKFLHRLEAKELSEVEETANSVSRWLSQGQDHRRFPVSECNTLKNLFTQSKLQALSNEVEEKTSSGELTEDERDRVLSGVCKLSRRFNGFWAFRWPTVREIGRANATLPDGLTVMENFGAPTGWNTETDKGYYFVHV